MRGSYDEAASIGAYWFRRLSRDCRCTGRRARRSLGNNGMISRFDQRPAQKVHSPFYYEQHLVEQCSNLDTLVLLLESWTNVPYDLALPLSVKRLGLRCEMVAIGSVYRLKGALKRAAGTTGSNIAEDSIGGLEVVRFFRPKSPSRPRGQSMGQQAENEEKERVKWEGMKTEIEAMCKMSFGDGERGFRVEYVD